MISATSPGESTIGDYGAIGDGRSAALVGRDGAIDWCCLPDFDSAACFARILDQARGGFWRLAPDAATQVGRSYVAHTLILQQEFGTATGRVRMRDFMPAGPSAKTGGGPRIIRLVEGREGTVRVGLHCEPRFDFGITKPVLEPQGRTKVLLHDGATTWSLAASFPLQIEGDSVCGNVLVRAGERHYAVFGAPVTEPTINDVERHLNETVEHWRTWVRSLRYEGLYADEVIRSALTLKLLTYEPTGAIVAAPTTSLPEVIGGKANWDYRFAWLRDAALTVDVFQRLGRHDESERFLSWFQRLPRPEALQPVYTIHGGPDLPKRELDHLTGFHGSRPVRVGNAAAPQHQLDAAGHIIEAASLCYQRLPRPMDPALWDSLCTIADQVCERWRDWRGACNFQRLSQSGNASGIRFARSSGSTATANASRRSRP